MSKSALTRTPPRGSGGMGLSWSDELTIYTLLPLHCAFHVARMRPNSKYEDISEILYRPSIASGGGTGKFWGDWWRSFERTLTTLNLASYLGHL